MIYLASQIAFAFLGANVALWFFVLAASEPPPHEVRMRALEIADEDG